LNSAKLTTLLRSRERRERHALEEVHDSRGELAQREDVLETIRVRQLSLREQKQAFSIHRARGIGRGAMTAAQYAVLESYAELLRAREHATEAERVAAEARVDEAEQVWLTKVKDYRLTRAKTENVAELKQRSMRQKQQILLLDAEAAAEELVSSAYQARGMKDI
jgi:hypothetical protein